MNKVIACGVLVCVSLFGCKNDNGIDDSTLGYVGRQRLEMKLKDPDSLKIINERLVRPGKNGGEVGYECKYRAKNSFGGYAVDTFYTE